MVCLHEQRPEFMEQNPATRIGEYAIVFEIGILNMLYLVKEHEQTSTIAVDYICSDL